MINLIFKYFNGYQHHFTDGWSFQSAKMLNNNTKIKQQNLHFALFREKLAKHLPLSKVKLNDKNKISAV